MMVPGQRSYSACEAAAFEDNDFSMMPYEDLARCLHQQLDGPSTGILRESVESYWSGGRRGYTR